MPFFDLYDDPEDVDCLVVATHRAIAEHFTEADWTQFAYETGTRNYILNHERLLRSLRWHDQGYKSCIFEVLHHFSEQKVSVFEALVRHPKIHPELERSVPTILQRLGLLSAHVLPVATTGLSAPDVVSRALLDTDALLSTSDAVSCIDRLHTAIHGYFRSVCERAGLAPPEGALLTRLYKLLRSQHLSLQNCGAHDQDITRVLSSFASAVDALNSIRNNASVAHPNNELLSEPEAHLMVNAVRTLFHYIRAKVGE